LPTPADVIGDNVVKKQVMHDSTLPREACAHAEVNPPHLGAILSCDPVG